MSDSRSQFGGGLGAFFGGLFGGDPQRAYKKGLEAYRPWMERSAAEMTPYAQAGQRAIPGYENWVAGMHDPSSFINNLMGNYQKSPNAQNLQDQAMRSGLNAASATGTLGSTPFANEMQQQASSISSQDMQQWLANVLGVNTQYGAGMGNLMNQGYGAAGNLANIFGQRAEGEGSLASGKELARQQRIANIFGGLGNMYAGIQGMPGFSSMFNPQQAATAAAAGA